MNSRFFRFSSPNSDSVARSVSKEEPKIDAGVTGNPQSRSQLSGWIGAGKVKIMFNGKEIAWVNTADPNDSKLLNEYLVRTLELVDGKNVIEIFVDGERVDHKAYSKNT